MFDIGDFHSSAAQRRVAEALDRWHNRQAQRIFKALIEAANAQGRARTSILPADISSFRRDRWLTPAKCAAVAEALALWPVKDGQEPWYRHLTGDLARLAATADAHGQCTDDRAVRALSSLMGAARALFFDPVHISVVVARPITVKYVNPGLYTVVIEDKDRCDRYEGIAFADVKHNVHIQLKELGKDLPTLIQLVRSRPVSLLADEDPENVPPEYLFWWGMIQICSRRGPIQFSHIVLEPSARHFKNTSEGWLHPHDERLKPRVTCPRSGETANNPIYKALATGARASGEMLFEPVPEGQSIFGLSPAP